MGVGRFLVSTGVGRFAVKAFVLVRFAAIAAFVFACSKPAAEADSAAPAAAPVVVSCVAARPATATEHIVLRGVVAAPPDRDAIVAAAVAGRIATLRVREGDRVKAGELLATLDDPALASAVIEGDAARAAAKASLANADAALARAQRLFDQGIVPRRDVEDAAARRAVALADTQASDARGQLARQQQSRARVTAPISGVVVRVWRRAGELVDGSAATPILEIADPAQLELRSDAPAAELVRLSEGAAAEIHLDAVPGSSLAAKIVYVAPSVDTVTSLGVVRATIAPAQGGALQPKLGLAGQIVVGVPGRAGVVLVPAVAVRRSAGGAEEVVVCESEAAGSAKATAKVREVTTGERTGNDVQIVSGLAAGERVVTRHVVALEDGVEFEVRP